jgi:hypothetical protein
MYLPVERHSLEDTWVHTALVLFFVFGPAVNRSQHYVNYGCHGYLVVNLFFE